MNRLSVQVIKFITLIIIARILTPEDFGLIGLLAIFLAIANTFVDSGLGEALIQKKEVNKTDISTVFIFNVFLGLILYGILFASAPLIADFFNEDRLINITKILALNVIITSFGLVQNSLLIKNIDFKKQSYANIISSVLSGIIGIIMAVRGYGVWALVFQTISQNFFRTLLLWLLIKIQILPRFSLSSFKQLFGFSVHLMSSWLINTIFENIYSLIIGKLYAIKDLGFYTKANRLQQIPTLTINGVIQSVSFPVLAKMQDNPNKLKENYRKLLKVFVAINFPVMIFLLVVSKPLIILLLTNKWEPAAPYLQLFCIIGLIYPIITINLNILKVVNKTRIYFNLNLFKKLLLVIGILLTFSISIKALILSQIIALAFGLLFDMYFSGKWISYSIREQFKDMMPYFIISLAMGLFMMVTRLFILEDNHLMTILTQSAIALLSYVGINHALKLDAYRELKEIISTRFNFNLKNGKR